MIGQQVTTSRHKTCTENEPTAVAKGQKRFENGAHRLCEGHVALRYTPRFKTKASSAPAPGTVMKLRDLFEPGRDYCKNEQRALAHI